MDELKIDIDTIGVGKDEYEIVSSCSVPFNKCINRIINNSRIKIKKLVLPSNKDTVDSFDRLKRNLELIRYECPNFAIARSFPHVIGAGDHIMKNNADYFLNRNYDALIKADGNKTMIYDVIKLVVSCFNKLSVDERNEIWELAEIMLICCIEFKKHIDATGLRYGQD